MIKFKDQSERKVGQNGKKGQNGFLVAQTTVVHRHENEKDQTTNNHKK